MLAFQRNPVRICLNWIGLLPAAAANKVAQHLLNKTPHSPQALVDHDPE
jgi:hypothetical protein